jgi:Prenyltransferase and squalene oxidase repeat
MWNSRQWAILGAGSIICLASGYLSTAADGVFHDTEPAERVEALPVQDAAADANLAKNMLDQSAKDAIDKGLEYLARNQHANGSFGTGQQHGSVAVTSLAGLAFMAGGHQPGRGKYGNVVTRALEYVLDQKDARGFLQHPQAALYGPMYGHGFGTLFLAETQGMVNQQKLHRRLRQTLNEAVDLIIRSQNNEGGWRYQPVARDADISVTICQIMALRAARNAGITIPKEVADKCVRYVKECQDLASGGFRYQRHVGRVGFARTAAGVVALYSAGQYDGDAVSKGLQYLKQFQPAKNREAFTDPEARIHYFYGHYYAAQAMWIKGGEHWKSWFPAIRDDLVSNSGLRQPDGSWSDRTFCPHYCTAMALIILQIPNNYLPILQR